MDRRTNELPNRPTNQPTDTASYRGALSHLKTVADYDQNIKSIIEFDLIQNSILSIIRFSIGSIAYCKECLRMTTDRVFL